MSISTGDRPEERAARAHLRFWVDADVLARELGISEAQAWEGIELANQWRARERRRAGKKSKPTHSGARRPGPRKGV